MFVSIYFPIFLVMTITLYFCVRENWRAGVLLLASWGFCGFLDKRALLVLILITVSAYYGGRLLERTGAEKIKKAILTAAVGFYVLLLCGYKYLPYGIARLGLSETVPDSVLEHLIMPMGLSFYLFQAIGYLADIYRKKSRAERNFVFFGLYMAFFVKLVSGPIERAEGFLSQLRRLPQVRFFDRGRLSAAFTYILWGYFMKLVVADRLALTVAKLFEGPQSYDSLWLFLGMLFYTFQIYCDFAGYSYIAVGCARIFGIELTQNFKAPYCAVSITDFWRRWHISLSGWLRDYIYIPLGGNRKGLFRKCLNTMIVFLICGMWHGAGFNFIAWGLLHGFYSVIDTLLGKGGRDGRLKRGIGRTVTFLAVSVAWVFFRATGFTSAVTYLWEMATNGFSASAYQVSLEMLGLKEVEIAVMIIAILVVCLIDFLCYRKNEHWPVLIQNRSNAVRYAVFYVLIVLLFVFGMYGPGYQAGDFIYMQF